MFLCCWTDARLQHVWISEERSSKTWSRAYQIWEEIKLTHLISMSSSVSVFLWFVAWNDNRGVPLIAIDSTLPAVITVSTYEFLSCSFFSLSLFFVQKRCCASFFSLFLFGAWSGSGPLSPKSGPPGNCTVLLLKCTVLYWTSDSCLSYFHLKLRISKLCLARPNVERTDQRLPSWTIVFFHWAFWVCMGIRCKEIYEIASYSENPGTSDTAWLIFFLSGEW